MKNIEKLKEIYLADDVDSEDYEDNLHDIKNWELDIIENENLLSWQEHDITKKIIEKAQESYISLSTRLSTDRDLTETQRMSIYAKQDAMKWIISLSGENPKSVLKDINNKIKIALKQ